jgi:hypothetical protein
LPLHLIRGIQEAISEIRVKREEHLDSLVVVHKGMVGCLSTKRIAIPCRMIIIGQGDTMPAGKGGTHEMYDTCIDCVKRNLIAG